MITLKKNESININKNTILINNNDSTKFIKRKYSNISENDNISKQIKKNKKSIITTTKSTKGKNKKSIKKITKTKLIIIIKIKQI